MLIVTVLFRIGVVYGGDHKDCRLPGCGIVWVYYKTDVSEERVASIFRVEEIKRAKKSVKLLLTESHSATSQNTSFFKATLMVIQQR
jgi:hypothetical protein